MNIKGEIDQSKTISVTPEFFFIHLIIEEKYLPCRQAGPESGIINCRRYGKAKSLD